MMTGYTAEDMVAKALSGGAYTCIQKPFDMEKVIAILEGIAR
jgi:DNA-binding NtrC family response regulator